MDILRRDRRFMIAVLFLGSILVFVGCAKRDDEAPKPPRKVVQPVVVVDRKTFSMHLPAEWTEDTKDDMYDPNSFVFFENAESCLFTVIIGKKSAGASVDEYLKNEKAGWLEKLTEAKSNDLEKWGNYEGKGFEMEGKIAGTVAGKLGVIVLTRVRVFGLENSDRACVISELATPGDFEKFASDFQKIRQSFRLK